MKLNNDEQVLYDFFVTFGKGVGSIGYPIAILATWTSGDEEKKTQVNLEYTRDGFATLVGSMMGQLRIYDEEANK